MGLGTIISNLYEMKKAAKYRKMGASELLNLEDEEFYEATDCLTCDTVEYDINNPDVQPEQRWVYSLIAFEREVNNGGLCQFFVNSSSICAPFVSKALEQIGALDVKAAYDDFLNENKIDVNDLSLFQIEKVEDYEDVEAGFDFDKFDDMFYADEDFHEKLLTYARNKISLLLEK